MLDWLLDEGWDLDITPEGDIQLVYSIPQAILVRLKWIEQEWRLGPAFGFPWFSQVFQKNPSIEMIKQSIRGEILSVDGVTGAEVTVEEFDRRNRRIKIRYKAYTNTETFVEEVVMNG